MNEIRDTIRNNVEEVREDVLRMAGGEALASKELGLKQTLDSSKGLLEAILGRRHSEVAALIEELHDEKIPFFNYSDDHRGLTGLSCYNRTFTN